MLYTTPDISLLDISGSFYGYRVPGLTQSGYFREATFAIRQKVSIPVLLTGAQAKELLQEGCADLIGAGRAILADFRWADKHMRR